MRGVERYFRREGKLADFTTTPRVVTISLMAGIIGAVCTFVAIGLVALIGIITNIAFYHRFSTSFVSPAGNTLGALVIIVPVVGGLIVGLMAKFGSERVRGHGIPEALESILFKGSRVEPRVVILKPVASAFTIGTGGPFGAEGPIIMTGGAFGSLVAQFFHLTDAERKTLLVAGAAAGMSAIFATPVAAVLLAIELLLFEFKPRSLIPVAIASTMAVLLRHYIMGSSPLFPVPTHVPFIGLKGLVGCATLGLLEGILGVILTIAVYISEDAFEHLPLHWMWWPILGGLVIGLGGFVFPPALGVGYDIIGLLLKGEAGKLILGILIVKSAIWALSLGSGVSGGVLAPLLMIGGALGALTGHILPNEGAGFWALIGMGASLGGTMRVPLTSIIFLLELTNDITVLLPLLMAVSVAYCFTVLAMRRSILTEKIARRGYHLSGEQVVDPLDMFFVRDVMHTDIETLSANTTLEKFTHAHLNQRLYPVVNDTGKLVGVIPRLDLINAVQELTQNEAAEPFAKIARRWGNPVVAYADEPLRVIAYRMAETKLTTFPVLERTDEKLVGLILLDDLLLARVRDLECEQRRERVLKMPWS